MAFFAFLYVDSDDETEVAVRRAWPASPFLPEQAPPPMLARAMADHELAGILLIEAEPGEGPVAERITMRLIPAPLPDDTH